MVLAMNPVVNALAGNVRDPDKALVNVGFEPICIITAGLYHRRDLLKDRFAAWLAFRHNPDAPTSVWIATRAFLLLSYPS